MNKAATKPESLSDLFFSFSVLALQGFGGVHSVAQREIVEKKRWLTIEEFIDQWALAQVVPGPNMVNFSIMLGGRHFGVLGSLAALGGLLAAPTLLILLLAVSYSQFGAYLGVAGAIRGLGAVAAGLVFAAALKMVVALQKNVMSLPVCVFFSVVVFILVGILRLPLLVALLGVGGFSCAAAYARMRV
jgi:chromate transporter